MTDDTFNPYVSPSKETPLSDTNRFCEMVLAGCLTLRDARMAHRISQWSNRLRLVSVTLLAGLFWLFLVAVAFSARLASPQASSVIFLVALLIFPGLPLAARLIDSYRLRTAARKRTGMFAATRWILSTLKITATTEHEKTELPWEMFSSCLANEKVALLYVRNQRSYLILSQQQLEHGARWDDLLDLIHTQLKVRGKRGVTRVPAPNSIWDWLTDSAFDREGRLRMLLDRPWDPVAFQQVRATPEEIRWSLGVICEAFNLPRSQLYALRPDDDLGEIYAVQTRYSWGDDLQYERLLLLLNEELGDFPSEQLFQSIHVTVQELIEFVASRRTKLVSIADQKSERSKD